MKLDQILVPLDGSKLAEQALPVAASFARAADASVHIIAIIPELTLYEVAGVAAALSRELDRSVARLRSYVDERVSELRAADVRATGGIAVDLPATGILDAANAAHADLIIMTSHGSGGLVRLWLGSVTDAVVRRASIPVMVLRPDDHLRQGNLKEMRIAKVLVPLDGSAASESALEPATGIARLLGASLTLFLVVESAPLISPELAPNVHYDPILLFEQRENAARYLDRVAARLRAQGIEAATYISDGLPVAVEITDYARANRMDLIVMGSHGRSGMRRLVIGSVADKVMRQADVPVLIARARSGLAAPNHQEEWHRQLAAFTERNRGRLVSIEIESLAFGSQREVERIALQSVDYDWHEDRLSIALRCEGDGHLTHRIGRPTRIDLLDDARGELLAVRSPEGQMLMHVHGPAVASVSAEVGAAPPAAAHPQRALLPTAFAI